MRALHLHPAALFQLQNPAGQQAAEDPLLQAQGGCLGAERNPLVQPPLIAMLYKEAVGENGPFTAFPGAPAGGIRSLALA